MIVNNGKCCECGKPLDKNRLFICQECQKKQALALEEMMDTVRSELELKDQEKTVYTVTVKEEGPQVSYICKERAKGKVCPGNGNLCSYESCHHTTDVRYAKNFAEVDDNKYVELDTWIPCSPGIKPKPYADVIFCDVDGEIFKGSMFDNGHWYNNNYDDPVKNVVAWMPLPEPYKKEGETND